ncbi:CBS domain-containing protein [Sphaerisporangium corydalis]|uniref:CBS domain-containing protein n=1 Tax=Sphaerisporangium corydalis TaxID=1441875 RepID=A0ABV9EVM6_9ACTN|nr:CBS domain-containing protein [Sphaerisporangium corydalis]
MTHDGSIVLRVADLPCARLGRLISLSPTDSLARAETLLTRHGVSRLPVLTEALTLIGAVDLESVTIARLCSRDHTLQGAIRPAETVELDAEVQEILPLLERHKFAFVEDERSRIIGIVTHRDAITALDRFSAPHRLLGEIERRLRRIINVAFPTMNELRDATGKSSLSSVDELSLGSIEHLLRRTDAWTRLGWRIDQAAFVEEIAGVRRIRNRFAHHHGSVLTAPADEEVEQLTGFLSWLRKLDTGC